MILFLGILLLDFFISLKVGLMIGYLASVLWIILSAILGIALLRLSPYALISNFQTFDFGQFDIRDLHNASMAYIGGSILLIVPGVLTDAIGVALFIYILYLHLFATMRPKSQRRDYKSDLNEKEGENDVIDVEIVDEPCVGDSTRRSD